MVEFKNMASKSVSCPHSLVATASRVTHLCAIEVCVIKTSLQIGLLSHFHTSYWLIQARLHCSVRHIQSGNTPDQLYDSYESMIDGIL